MSVNSKDPRSDKPDATPHRRSPPYIAIAALGGLIAGVAGVYVSGWGTVHADARCEASSRLASALKPLARGEVAALVTADEPQDLAALTFQTVDGTPRALADFGGRIVLLNLWATWCVPCRTEMPALDRLQREKRSDGFEVVTVNIDVGRPDKPAAFLNEIGAGSLPDYRDPKMGFYNALKSKGLAFGLPTTLIVDGSGCQVAALHGPAEWDSADAKAVIDAAIAFR